MLQAIVFRMNGSWDFRRGSWAWIMVDHGGSCGHDPGIARTVGSPSSIRWIHEALIDPMDP